MAAKLQASRWFQYTYFLRFSLFAWLFLFALALLDWGHITSSITRGILTLDSDWQAFYAAFFIVALHMTALVTARNTTRNGEERFLTPLPPILARALTSSTTPTVWAVLGTSQIPTAFILWYLAHNANIEAERYTFFGERTANIWVFFFVGILAALLFWYLVSLFYYWTYRPSLANPCPTPAALIFPHNMFGDIADAMPPARFARLVERVTRLVLKISCAGYAKTPSGPLWELHFLSALSLVGIFLLYLFLYPLTGPIPRSSAAFYAQIVLCASITAAFLVAIAGTRCESSTPGVPCYWARRVKWTFILLALIIAGLFLTALIYDHFTRSVRLEMAFPTLGSILVLAGFFTWLFSGAAFFFDRYRVPVLTAVLAVIFIPKLAAPPISEYLVEHKHPWLGQVFNSDHYYTVFKLDGPLDLNSIPTPAEVLTRRAADPNDVYIIVTASGGGIQAAEWTSQILASLETAFASDTDFQSAHYTFNGHLLLASGVSGGSVGLLPFLLEYTAHDSAHLAKTFFPMLPPSLISGDLTLADRITRPSGCSSLEAVGWGLAYHDLFRLVTPIRIPGSPASDTSPDRTWALAAAINRNLHDVHCRTSPELFPNLPPIMDGNGLTLKGSAEMLTEGTLPAFTFNTTAAETGSRFLLSNYRVPAPRDGAASTPHTDFVPSESFLQVYSTDGRPDGSTPGKPLLYADLALATAARLSATFPIVSSGTRIPPAYTAQAYHFLDGGYFDNDGTASVIEFLKSALDDDSQKSRILKLLLIEIRDDDGNGVTTNSDDLAHQNGHLDDTDKLQAPSWTPVTQLTGILGGLWNAGHVSIARRNRRELCVLEKAYSHLEIHHLVFTIPTGDDSISPLSWNLTSGQLASITDRRDSTETKSMLTQSIKWVKDARLRKDVSAFDVCKAWVEPATSNAISRVEH